MTPPSAISPERSVNGDGKPSATAPHEPGLSESQASVQMPKFPTAPTFTDKYAERDYLKGRLAAAFRIFGKYGYDEVSITSYGSLSPFTLLESMPKIGTMVANFAFLARV